MLDLMSDDKTSGLMIRVDHPFRYDDLHGSQPDDGRADIPSRIHRYTIDIDWS